MKKFFMIAVFIAASGFLFAQSPSVQFGLKGGINIASLDVKNGVDFKSRTSFYAGGLAHIHVSPHFAVQPEIYYSGQGGKNGSFVARYGYLNVPVLGQLMVGDGFRLQTGPQLGILLSAELEDEQDHITTNIKGNLNTVDFSWSFGASYLIPNCGLGIDGRYNLGITKVNDGGVNDLKNRVWAIGLFYQFMNNHSKH